MSALIRDIQSLEPETRKMAEAAIAILKAQGIRYFINETLRKHEVQCAYYAQGRQNLEIVNQMRRDVGLRPLTSDENKKTITNSLTKSKHLTGEAIDICPATKGGDPWWSAPQGEYQKIADIMKTCGFEWGGDWKGAWDQPHYQKKDKV